MDQTVHVYILHPLFLWYTSSVGPLTFSNKPPHSLTHSLTAAVFFSHLILLFIHYNEVSFHNEIVLGVNICRWQMTSDWTTGFSGLSLFTPTPHCVHMGSMLHIWGRGGRGLHSLSSFFCFVLVFILFQSDVTTTCWLNGPSWKYFKVSEK